VTKERWQRVADVYDAAHDKTPSQRLPFVREASAGDSDLRRQVESLLAEDDESGVLDTPIQIAVGEVLNDNAPMLPGSFVGPYRIDTLLGVGGMGEVYRARDTKLNRDVAIKILPSAFASDPDRLARFKREAQVLASLNHPNVGGIYGFENSGGIHALVLELVEGPTLADILASGSRRQASGRAGLPLDEAVAIARQIADALEAAHEQGVIHRDLKPANIKVREDGTVKVLDFGLAKLTDPVGVALQGGPSMTQSPTITTPAMSHAGMILGTAAYMSPEQAKGRPADRRSDIWAFGCVLYEMLTGRRAFDGEDVSETLAAILRADPNWDALPAATPQPIRRVLSRCLQKDRLLRLQHIGDARLDILDGARGDSPTKGPSEQRSRPPGRQPFLVAGVAAIALIAGAWAVLDWAARRQPSPVEMRLDITTPPSPEPTAFALSPDARSIVYVASPQGTRQLWVRELNQTTARLLQRTDGAQYPFWSPDSRSIGFFAGNRLQRIDVDGGPPRALANVLTPGGGTWNRDGIILYVPNTAGSVFTVREDGREAKPNADVDPRTLSHRHPSFLPDGHHFLVHAGVGESRGLYIGELGKSDLHFVVNSDTGAIFTSNQLLFARGNTLFAQPFDLRTFSVSGSVTRIVDNVAIGQSAGVGVSASASGLIAYRIGQSEGRRFAWFDRTGKEVSTVGVERTSPSNPSLSLDGRFLALQDARPSENSDIWVIDLEKQLDTRLTLDPSIDALPVWSPDGTRIVFNSNRNRGTLPRARSDLYVRSTSPDAPDEPLLLSDDSKFACDWSNTPDGQFILYRSMDPATGTYDLMAVPFAGDRKPFPVVRTQYDERDGQFAPNGKSIVFQSDKTGRPEIYVQAFPKGKETRVSGAGGTQARWRADGKELFYLSNDNRMMAVPITKWIDGQAEFGTPVALFQTRAVGISGTLRQQYVVTKDGQRFLINVTTDQGATSPITILLNWRHDP
jgi:eukaryotic-like serine/threonine-protein kinase